MLVDEMEATDGEMPSCLHACGAIVFSQKLSTSNSLFWHVLSLAGRTFRVDYVRVENAIGRQCWHELGEMDRVIVILVDEDS